jgi:hypothetical protein
MQSGGQRQKHESWWIQWACVRTRTCTESSGNTALQKLRDLHNGLRVQKVKTGAAHRDRIIVLGRQPNRAASSTFHRSMLLVIRGVPIFEQSPEGI